MKRWICLLLAALLLLTPAMALEQPTDEELKISAPSAILMERSTGTVLSVSYTHLTLPTT